MSGSGSSPLAILFDKDGTLFDFAGTWNTWAARVIHDLADGDDTRRQRLADAARYDLERDTFWPDSPIIAGTAREAVDALATALPDRPLATIDAVLSHHATNVPLVEATPLAPMLDNLVGRGLALGVMTNDTEDAARAHLDAAGVLDRFRFVAGFDSGFGAKPEPDPLLAFCRAVDVAPARAVMVGDSTHDLIAGRAAGMITVGVLTGMAPPAVLEPHADAILPDIGHLPAWLAV